ncbi:MAG: cytochrome c, partial [Verrucomicrobia bacterium]|nr:cytochrome c [Verrucomicrobiota bacterium]
MRSTRWLCAGLLFVGFVLGAGPDGWAGSLSPEEARGKRIFREGLSEAGRMITARVGRSSTPMPGKTFPCASCHGLDGRGRPEGGVVPADITWSKLTTPLVSTGGTERARSAYSGGLISGAITGGLNADGAALDFTMPRFEMHEDDLRDVVA